MTRIPNKGLDLIDRQVCRCRCYFANGSSSILDAICRSSFYTGIEILILDFNLWICNKQVFNPVWHENMQNNNDNKMINELAKESKIAPYRKYFKLDLHFHFEPCTHVNSWCMYSPNLLRLEQCHVTCWWLYVSNQWFCWWKKENRQALTSLTSVRLLCSSGLCGVCRTNCCASQTSWRHQLGLEMMSQNWHRLLRHKPVSTYSLW